MSHFGPLLCLEDFEMTKVKTQDIYRVKGTQSEFLNAIFITVLRLCGGLKKAFLFGKLAILQDKNSSESYFTFSKSVKIKRGKVYRLWQRR